MIDIRLKNFQERAVEFLLDATSEREKQPTVLHAPTGSGKTIILIYYIERYLEYADKIVFCWLTPGKGNLEVQSKEKMEKYAPNLRTASVDDTLRRGFEENTTYFINWEKITKKGNVALNESEKLNLFEQIKVAHNKGYEFIVIIDEEHLNNTSNANDIINALARKNEIRVSATPIKRSLGKLYSIDEVDVIDEGLITRAIYINYDLDKIENGDIEYEAEILIEKAVSLRKEIAKEYEKVGDNINPLVLIQFPNLNDELIERVEEILETYGYTYDNKNLASWFSAESKEDKERKSKKLGKINIGEGTDTPITKEDSKVDFLLFKQALATGWDCPRAKILIKLRDNMSESFEIQTLGRLRRMPKAHHYDNELLDNSYLYTFDEDYKNDALSEGAYEVVRVFLKEEPKNICLKKELRDLDQVTVSEATIRKELFDFIKKKYNLTTSVVENKKAFENRGYLLKDEIRGSYLSGKVIKLAELEKGEHLTHNEIFYRVSTHAHGMDLRHNIDSFKKFLGLDYGKTRALMQTFFLRHFGNKDYKFLSLNLREFYAFIINNADIIRELLKEFYGNTVPQMFMDIARVDDFRIPLEENYRVKEMKHPKLLEKNVYDKYTSAMVVSEFRSTSERLFERHCENSDRVKFVYKNGDKGSRYLSILYHTGAFQTLLFYPDYIVELNSGDIWIIETKGGERAGQDKNIDNQVKNKFKAFKDFAQKYNYKFAFVRDRDEELFYNNTEYVDSLDEDSWKEIKEIF